MSLAAGTYRTLCVRSCDGYYFPISFSTTREHFPADEAICEKACPGAEAQIYYHAVSGEGPESMIALDGSPYAQHAAAFSYRTALNPSCTCGRPQGHDLLARAEPGAAAAPGIIAAAPVPRPRQAPGEDPETLANRSGQFVPRAAARRVAGIGREIGGVRSVGTDGRHPVLTSPVPNDLETSLLWAESPGSGPAQDGGP